MSSKLKTHYKQVLGETTSGSNHNMNLEADDVEGLAVMESWTLASIKVTTGYSWWCDFGGTIRGLSKAQLATVACRVHLYCLSDGYFKQSRTVAFTVTRSQLYSFDVRGGGTGSSADRSAATA